MGSPRCWFCMSLKVLKYLWVLTSQASPKWTWNHNTHIGNSSHAMRKSNQQRVLLITPKINFYTNTKQVRNEKTTAGINLKRIFEESTAEGRIDFESWPWSSTHFQSKMNFYLSMFSAKSLIPLHAVIDSSGRNIYGIANASH